MKKYVCNVCGYVYDPAEGDPDNGVAAGTAWDPIQGESEDDHIQWVDHDCTLV